MHTVFAEEALMPVVRIVPRPGCDGLRCVNGRGGDVHRFKMLLPLVAFDTYPCRAVASLEVCKTFTASKTISAIVADTVALGTMLTAVFADDGAEAAG